MTMCNFFIGMQVVVNKNYMLTAWPCAQLPLASIHIFKTTAEIISQTNIGENMVLIENVLQPCLVAAHVQLKSKFVTFLFMYHSHDSW